MPTKVIMPQLGESVVEGTVTKWLIHEGEPIHELDSLLEVNTDKVDTEVPSPSSGTLLKILIPEGTTVRAGTVLAWIGQPGEAIPDGNGHSAQEGAPREAEKPQEAPREPLVGRSEQLGFISPVVAKLAHEYNLDLAQVKGTGANGRITKQDVLAYVEKQPQAAAQAQPQPAAETAAWETPVEGDLFKPTELIFGKQEAETARQKPPLEAPAPAAAPTPTPLSMPVPRQPQEVVGPEQVPGEVVPLSILRKTIAERMVMSERTSPHVSTIMEADMSRVVAHREANLKSFERDGANLTYTAYFAAAATAALKAFPLVNSSWTDEGIRLHREINVGIAVSLGEDGLIVPVIQRADSLSLLGLARAVNDLSTRARGRKLLPDEVKNGTFTITNHGITGSLFATPIINQPQSAILGVGVIQKRVVVINDAIAIRPMVYLSLTFDHRILDGAIADRFLGKVVETLQNWV